jgi:hypothetical protein
MRIKSSFSSIFLFSFVLLSCSKNENHSYTKGIIGENNSEVVDEKPPFAEFLLRQASSEKLINCNGVRVSGDRFFTAAHCVKNFKDSSVISLSGKGLGSNFVKIENLDLAVGRVVGGSAPSNSLKLAVNFPDAQIRLESVWFDIETNQWRKSKGVGLVSGSFILHDLDMNPGASGAGLYIQNENSVKELIAIHLGFVESIKKNLAVSIVGDFENSKGSVDSFSYNPEFCYYRDGSPAPEYKCQKPDEGGDDNGSPGNGDGGTGGSGTGGTGTGGTGPGGGTGGTGGESGGGDPGAGGPETSDSDDGEVGGSQTVTPGQPSSDGRGGGVIFPIGNSPGGGSGSGGGRTGETTGTPCFECDQVYRELNNQTEFGDDCGGSSSIEPLFRDVNVQENFTPPFTFSRENSTKFTESLRYFAEKLIKTTKWNSSTSQELPEDTQAQLKEWLEKVVRNLDDYYALVIAMLKDSEAQAPALTQIDTSKEAIDEARRYLDAVKSQIELNPDRYLEARREAVRGAETAFGLADEALGNGDQETANAAREVGIALADAAIGFTPVFGWVKDVIEAGSGYSVLTGKPLDDWSRKAAWVGVFTAGLGSKVLTVGKVAVVVAVTTKLSKTGKFAANGERIFLEAKQLYNAAKAAGINSNVRERVGGLIEAVKFKKPLASATEIETEVLAGIERYKNLPLINGEKPINGLYAGQTYFDGLTPELKIKYPEGVKFSENGFPEFSKYTKELPNGGKSVKIEPTLSHEADVRSSNKLAGFRETPDNYTWHHHQDYGVMELIPTDIHNAVKHTGGATIWGYKTK